VGRKAAARSGAFCWSVKAKDNLLMFSIFSVLYLVQLMILSYGDPHGDKIHISCR